jgi:aryl-alcohol dehydrogenase-like predicted oxidoreductase
MIERAPFGNTGHESTRVIFGSAGLGFVGQERADEVLPVLLGHGVNHIDTAAAYGDAELRLAPWLAAHPGEFFVATKTGERSADGARASLERSLERLGVDKVDLIQLHNLVEEDEWQLAHGPGGALEALVAARAEGLVSHVGVTGHGLRIARMHLRSLERFDYDSVLLPYNFLLLRDTQYRAEVEDLLALCAQRNIAVQTIKGIARRRWQEPAGPDESAATSSGHRDRERHERLSWYEPLDDESALVRAVHYVLGRDRLFLVTSSDFRKLEAVLSAAERPAAIPSETELAADVQDQVMLPLFDGKKLERI